MIRRDQSLPDGRPGWVLIRQPDHAVLSGQMAAVWGGAEVAPLAPREVVVPTIDRHDDGWREWERMPEIDPIRGVPFSFLEMATETAQGIWRRSVDRVADLGPLAQHLVAMHFVSLRRQGQGAETGAGAAFIEDYALQAENWLEEWLSTSPHHTPEMAATALRHLQLFDALSLWLCCNAELRETQFATPNGPELTFTPLPGSAVGDEPQSIRIAPWPLSVDRLTLRVPGRHVPVRSYSSATELAAEIGESVELRWTLEP